MDHDEKYLMNTSNSPLIVPLRKGGVLEFAAQGDPAKGDYVFADYEILRDPGVRDALKRGFIVTVDQDPEEISVEHAAELAQRAHEARQAERARVTAVLDTTPQDRGMVGVECIGPGARPTLNCGATVLRKAAVDGEIPPLCSKHQSLAPEYVLTEHGSPGEGASGETPGPVRKVWTRVSVAR